MPRKQNNPCKLRIQDAADIMGVDMQALALCLQAGYYSDFGEAVKSVGSNYYSYDISKFKLYQRLGLDVNVSVEDTIKLIRAGSPPYIKQLSISHSLVMAIIEAIKKDAPTANQ